MNITLSPFQFISICMGLGLIAYFWGAYTASRHMVKLIQQGLKTELENWFLKQ